MLVLKRKKGETIKIDGGIEITVTEIGSGNVKLGITAPTSIKVRRSELGEFPVKPGPESNIVPPDGGGPSPRLRAA
jgi:carbon storage regulator CsrA